MQLSAETPRRSTTIQGQTLNVAVPFTPGHTLTENEASALNQLVVENVRNNFANRIKRAGDKVGETDWQTELDKYMEKYEFGSRTGGGQRLDPIQKEARTIARQKVTDKLKSKGIKLSEVTAEKMNAYIEDVLRRYPAITETAKKNVKAREKVASEEIDFDEPAAA